MVYAQDSKIVIALDYDDKKQALALLEHLDPRLCRLKVGKAMFTQLGPEWINFLIAKGYDVFLDLKYHDIPNTVYGACRQAARLGAWMINVHALGGQKMLEAAARAVSEVEGRRPLLIGVTLLTSLSQEDLKPLNMENDLESIVIRLAGLCKASGLDGVVCSPLEVERIKHEFGQDFLCVTPGIRLSEDDKGDQQRVMTPEKACALGSDYLVVGRSITQSREPRKVLEHIQAQLKQVHP